jgi:integrase
MVRKDTPEERQAYEHLLEACLSLDSAQDEKKLSSLKMDFLKSSQNLHKQVETFKGSLAKAPVCFLVLLWGEFLSNDKMFGKKYLGMLRDLVDAELLTLVTNKKKTETLQDLSLQDPSLVIDRIRCYKDWSIHKREDYVLLYKTFSEWMSKETFGYIPEAKDLDRIATRKRLIPFETYMEIINQMDLREQILAKIFYLGGPRALEDVLSLKIEDIDFDRLLIHFPEDISYPRHLFEDIKRYLEGRKKGFVFMGREGERVSTTTPFRALKKITSELNLDPEFTFKEFTKNI